MRRLLALVFTVFLSINSTAQEIDPNSKNEIRDQIEKLREAHLNSDTKLGDKIYHPNLILTSQSGKKYTKEVALLNLKNTFESYESSDIEFLKVTDNVVITNYINERKYKDFGKGIYRLTLVWKKDQEAWRIISMQSSKIKKRN